MIIVLLDKPLIDDSSIVLVHGLGGDARSSWTAKAAKNKSSSAQKISWKFSCKGSSKVSYGVGLETRVIAKSPPRMKIHKTQRTLYSGQCSSFLRILQTAGSSLLGMTLQLLVLLVLRWTTVATITTDCDSCTVCVMKDLNA